MEVWERETIRRFLSYQRLQQTVFHSKTKYGWLELIDLESDCFVVSVFA